MFFIPLAKRPKRKPVAKPAPFRNVGARLTPRGTGRHLMEKLRSKREIEHEIDFDVKQKANVIHHPTTVSWRVAGAENKKKGKRH